MSSLIDASGAELLHDLFGGEPVTPFRHRMGLTRADLEGAREFYSPGSLPPDLLAEKRAILAGPHAALYRVLSAEGDEALGEWATQLRIDLPRAPDTGEPGWLVRQRAATLACEPDLLLLQPPRWELIWASVCFPTRWSLERKGREPLHKIHAAVPDLNATLGRQIDVFFDRLAPGQSWQRANWGLAATAQRNQHPALPLPTIRADSSPAELFLRLEQQHFFKLPASGVIAFGIRILSYPLESVLANPGWRQGLREKLRTMSPAVADYKGIPAGWWQKL